jgi:DNA-binding winged helix-turn-helix (wHTH) protein/Tol biopolymer transport system component
MARYTFGPFSLDPESRVLLSNGEPVPMAGKTLDALVMLVQNRGRLVDKDELLSRIWAGSVVEEANLTQTIFTVRKVLGDSPKDHRYIATVAGRGYQFVAPVTESTITMPTADGLGKETRQFWHRNRVLQLGAAVTVLAGLVGMGFWLVRQPARDRLPEPIPFTSGVGFTRDPAFSPDGKQIAYSWMAAGDVTTSIYVKLVGGDTELAVTTSPGSDVVPAWSPDGRSIAFFRQATGKSGYYVVSALGGPVRQILHTRDDNGPGVTWFPDGRHIAIVLSAAKLADPPPEKSGWNLDRIVSVDFETGEQKYLTRPELEKALGDQAPAVSPDGRTVAFIRLWGADSADILLVTPDGRRTRRLTNVGAKFKGIAWTPDSRGLVYAMELNGRSRLWRMPINGGAASPITSSLELVYSPAVARQGNRLAYGVATGHDTLAA